MRKYRWRKWRKAAAVLALAIFAALGTAGCKFGETEVVFTSSLSENDVFLINDRTCSLAEAKVFLTNYQNLYGTVYGINLWDHDFGDNSLKQYVKDLTISQLAQIMSMDFLAEQQEISLSEEEVRQVERAAREYYQSLTKEEIRYMGVDEAVISGLYRQYGLANKLYAQLTADINEEVSDDEARVMEAYRIFVSSQEKADKVTEGLSAGADFLTLAGSYNEESQAEITFGRGTLPAEVETIAFGLEPEGISDAIQTEGGWYFIKCISNYNQELTDENKQVILERRRKEAFDDVYEAFVETLSSQFNQELWDGIEIQADDKIKTKSFFETYEKFCKW